MRPTRALAKVEHLGIVGMGLMGHGLAQASAQVGIKVTAVDIDSAQLSKGMKAIEGSLNKLLAKDVKKGVLTAQGAEAKFNDIRKLITASGDQNTLKDCDLVIEAIVENKDIKKKFFSDLGKIVKPECILASNTSSFSVTELGESSGRPSKFAGLHFFNPVQLMKLVEVIKTAKTEEQVFQDCWEYTKRIGKEPVACGDTPGFIVNRLLVPFMSQALLMLDRGDAEVEDIDTGMKYGAGVPMGPLLLADYVGLDTCLSILKGWNALDSKEPAYAIPKCLEEKVAAKTFGRKTGRGFYIWEGDVPKGVAK